MGLIDEEKPTERHREAYADHQAALSGYDHALSVFEAISDE
jgi:hypothetical protein